MGVRLNAMSDGLKVCDECLDDADSEDIIGVVVEWDTCDSCGDLINHDEDDDGEMGWW